jgi:hypothetical protein
MGRPMRVFSAVFALALLTVPAYAQMPSIGLLPEATTKTPEEIEAEQARDKAYRESLKKIPDAKATSDPWGTVRTDPPKAATKSATAKPKTKTGSTTN